MSATPRLPLARRFWVALPTAGLIALAGCQSPTQNTAANAAPATPSTTAAPKPPAAPLSPVATVEGITEYVLPNGLRVLLAPDASKPTTTVNMTYRVGSRHENYGETGMAHLLEHMLFKGTPTHRNALAEFARRGLRANGSTWTDRTNYFASFSANADNLDWYLRWQADAMVNSLIQRSDLDSEMTVVRNEMESGENSPFRILMEKMLSTSFQWHNYGKTTIGARADVENVDTDRLRAFYHQYYQPDNAVLIVSGAFDPKTTLATIQDAFAPIPKPTRKLPNLYTLDPVQDGERSVTLRRSGGAPLVSAMYHVPAAASPDYTAIDLAAIILGDTPSGRLHKALVDARLAAGTFGSTFDMHDPGVVMFGAQLPPGADRDKATAVMLKTLESLKTQPITSEELERARIKWLQSWELTYADAQKLGVALSESIAAGDWRLFFLARDRVRDAKLADVQRVAQSYLVESNRTLGTYIPTEQPVRSPAPQTVDVTPMVQDYRGNPNFVEAEAFDPSPANLDARTTRKTIALPNNGQLQLAMLPKPTRGNRVSAQLLMQFGNADTLRGKRDISDATAELIARGTKTMTRQQIDDALDKLNAQVGISGGGTNVTASISTTRENLAPTVALVVDLLRNASFPADQVEEYRRSSLTSIEQQLQQPDAIAGRALARHGNPYPADDLRYVPTFQEDLQAVRTLKREDIVRFHQQFYGAGMLRMSAVGDFDPATLESTLTKSLTGWKAAPAYTRVPNPYVAIAPTKLEAETPDKANAFYIAKLPVQLQDTDADYPALMLANFMFGLSEHSRLWNRVREKEGLSYNVRSMLRASSFEPSGAWQMYAIYAPQNRAKLEATIQEEIALLKKDGFTEQEVKDGIEALLNYRRLSRAQDGAVAGGWIDLLEANRTFAFTGEVDRKLQSLTAADVNAAFRKYFDAAAFASSYAGDFAGAAKKQ
jgi:zinc protease